MKKSVLIFIIGTAVLLNGCMTAPEYEQPEAPIPDSMAPGVNEVNGSAEPGTVVASEIGWEDFIADTNLQQVIRTALDNNRDLRLSALNVERARAIYGIQRAELLPVIDITGSQSKQKSSAALTDPADPRTTESFSVDLGIASWELDFFGRIRNLKKKALQEYLATGQAFSSARIILISEVARVYLVLAADRENLKLAQSTHQSQNDAYELVRKQYDSGIATELDLHRVKTQVDTARVNIELYTRLERQDRNALNLLAGSVVPDNLLPGDMSGIKPPQDIRFNLSSEVLLSRPDIMAAEYQLKAAYAYISAARSAFFPRISLTTSIGMASGELSGLFDADTDTWSFAPAISIPVFDARTWAAYRVSKTTKEIALTQYEKSIQTAFREVADSLAVFETVDRQIAAQESIAVSMQKIYDLAGKRYNQGLDSYLNVLDAQRSLFAAQQGLTSLRLVRLANMIKLYAVLGGGRLDRKQ